MGAAQPAESGPSSQSGAPLLHAVSLQPPLPPPLPPCSAQHPAAAAALLLPRDWVASKTLSTTRFVRVAATCVEDVTGAAQAAVRAGHKVVRALGFVTDRQLQRFLLQQVGLGSHQYYDVLLSYSLDSATGGTDETGLLDFVRPAPVPQAGQKKARESPGKGAGGGGRGGARGGLRGGGGSGKKGAKRRKPASRGGEEQEGGAAAGEAEGEEGDERREEGDAEEPGQGGRGPSAASGARPSGLAEHYVANEELCRRESFELLRDTVLVDLVRVTRPSGGRRQQQQQQQQQQQGTQEGHRGRGQQQQQQQQHSAASNSGGAESRAGSGKQQQQQQQPGTSGSCSGFEFKRTLVLKFMGQQPGLGLMHAVLKKMVQDDAGCKRLGSSDVRRGPYKMMAHGFTCSANVQTSGGKLAGYSKASESEREVANEVVAQVWPLVRQHMPCVHQAFSLVNPYDTLRLARGAPVQRLHSTLDSDVWPHRDTGDAGGTVIFWTHALTQQEPGPQDGHESQRHQGQEAEQRHTQSGQDEQPGASPSGCAATAAPPTLGGAFVLYDHLLKLVPRELTLLYLQSQDVTHGSKAPTVTGPGMHRVGAALLNNKSNMRRAATEMTSTGGVKGFLDPDLATKTKRSKLESALVAKATDKLSGEVEALRSENDFLRRQLELTAALLVPGSGSGARPRSHEAAATQLEEAAGKLRKRGSASPGLGGVGVDKRQRAGMRGRGRLGGRGRGTQGRLQSRAKEEHGEQGEEESEEGSEEGEEEKEEVPVGSGVGSGGAVAAAGAGKQAVGTASVAAGEVVGDARQQQQGQQQGQQQRPASSSAAQKPPLGSSRLHKPQSLPPTVTPTPPASAPTAPVPSSPARPPSLSSAPCSHPCRAASSSLPPSPRAAASLPSGPGGPQANASAGRRAGQALDQPGAAAASADEVVGVDGTSPSSCANGGLGPTAAATGVERPAAEQPCCRAGGMGGSCQQAAVLRDDAGSCIEAALAAGGAAATQVNACKLLLEPGKVEGVGGGEGGSGRPQAIAQQEVGDCEERVTCCVTAAAGSGRAACKDGGNGSSNSNRRTAGECPSQGAAGGAVCKDTATAGGGPEVACSQTAVAARGRGAGGKDDGGSFGRCKEASMGGCRAETASFQMAEAEGGGGASSIEGAGDGCMSGRATGVSHGEVAGCGGGAGTCGAAVGGSCGEAAAAAPASRLPAAPAPKPSLPSPKEEPKAVGGPEASEAAPRTEPKAAAQAEAAPQAELGAAAVPGAQQDAAGTGPGAAHEMAAPRLEVQTWQRPKPVPEAAGSRRLHVSSGDGGAPAHPAATAACLDLPACPPGVNLQALAAAVVAAATEGPGQIAAAAAAAAATTAGLSAVAPLPVVLAMAASSATPAAVSAESPAAAGAAPAATAQAFAPLPVVLPPVAAADGACGRGVTANGHLSHVAAAAPGPAHVSPGAQLRGPLACLRDDKLRKLLDAACANPNLHGLPQHLIHELCRAPLDTLIQPGTVERPAFFNHMFHLTQRFQTASSVTELFPMARPSSLAAQEQQQQQQQQLGGQHGQTSSGSGAATFEEQLLVAEVDAIYTQWLELVGSVSGKGRAGPPATDGGAMSQLPPVAASRPLSQSCLHVGPADAGAGTGVGSGVTRGGERVIWGVKGAWGSGRRATTGVAVVAKPRARCPDAAEVAEASKRQRVGGSAQQACAYWDPLRAVLSPPPGAAEPDKGDRGTMGAGPGCRCCCCSSREAPRLLGRLKGLAQAPAAPAAAVAAGSAVRQRLAAMASRTAAASGCTAEMANKLANGAQQVLDAWV